MPSALVVGGTRFIGRHTVSDLLDHDYGVTTFTRSETGNPFIDASRDT
jgi:nucleoside-diphosphate-sugar epimerase